VQEAPDRLTVNVVLERGASPDSVSPKLAGVSDRIRLLMGPERGIDYRFVEDIPLTRSGKLPYVIRRGSAAAQRRPEATAA
jgi:acyl-coenzyme A synthetase/AMP-(fatty) acid ligase